VVPIDAFAGGVNCGSIEAGLRGQVDRDTSWRLGVFRADILIVTDQQAGFGYFKNSAWVVRPALRHGDPARRQRLRCERQLPGARLWWRGSGGFPRAAQSTFFAPGAPRRVSLTLKLRCE
jgi:hypothetical protein